MTFVAGASGIAAVVVVTSRLDTLTQQLEPLAEANASLLQDLTNAETGQRGYVLTRERLFLQPYHQGVNAFPGSAAQAERLIGPDPAARAELAAELRDGRRWINDYAKPSLEALGGLPGPVPMPAGGQTPPAVYFARGKNQLDAFRAANTALDTSIRKAIVEAETVAHNTKRGALAGVGLVTLLAMVLGTAAAYQVDRAVVPPLQDLAARLARLRRGETGLRIQPAGTSEVRAVGVAVNELADSNEAAARERSHREQLRAIGNDVARRVGKHLEIDMLLAEATERIGTALEVDLVWILLDDDADSGADWHSPRLAPVLVDGGPSRDALRRHLTAFGPKPHRIDVDPASGHFPDHLPDTLIAQLLSHVGTTGLTSVAMYPLSAAGTAIGIMVLGQVSRPLAWGADEVSMVEGIGIEVVRAVLNARLYERQRTLVRDLQALDRTRDEFVSTVSHELRSPLTSIRGYLELLHDGDAGALTVEQTAMVEIVQRNAIRLGLLVEDLLYLSRLESSEIRLRADPVRVADVIASVVESVRPDAEQKGLDVVLDGDGSDPWVNGDAAALERVVLNLVGNAIKFTPAPGTVTVDQRTGEGHVALSVTDTGIGIPEKDQARLFERFFRASNASEGAIPGTGLGLHIVQGLVECHGGTLSLRSNGRRGSTFLLTLPAIHGTARGSTSTG